MNPSCSSSSLLSYFLFSVLSPDPSECVIQSGYSVSRNVMTYLRLKVVLFERMTSMRMKISLRLSAAGFPLAMGRLFFEFSCTKLNTSLLWMGFINLLHLLRIPLETLHEVCGKRQCSPSNTPEFPEMLLCQVAMFKRQADVDVGHEKGSHDSVTALNKTSRWRPSVHILLTRDSIAGCSIVFFIPPDATVPSQTFRVGWM